MNYAMDNIKVKENWFQLINDNNFDNKFKQFGYKGLYIYLTMFKFRIYKQQHDYFFLFSISLIRKETDYTTIEILDILKIFKRLGILKFEGLSRWDYLIDDKGKVKDKELIICYASDMPQTELISDEKRAGRMKDSPITDEDKYVSLDLRMFQYYQTLGLSERFYPLYCIFKYYQDINPEKKSYVSIQKIAATVGYDKDTVHKMIREMNRNYILCSKLRGNGKDAEYFEHYLCGSVNMIEHYKTGTFKDDIDKNIKKWDKKAQRKVRSRVKSIEKKKTDKIVDVEIDYFSNDDDPFL